MLTLLAHAKINLYLEIIGSRPDGFHELVMIMQSVGLSDIITLKPLKASTIHIICDHPQVPTDSQNLAYQAVTLLQKRLPNRTNPCGGVEITIDKRIPIGAGLAGGSSNAAAVLFGLNVLWRLGLTRIELQELGAELGSDVPFSLVGGCAIATGRGEETSPIRKAPCLYAVLAKYTSLSVSTPWAYKTYRQQFESTYQPLDKAVSLEDRLSRIHSSGMVKALSSSKIDAIAQHLSNDLEKVVLPQHEKVAQLKEKMAAIASTRGSLGTMMSGSGPTVFTLTETVEQAQDVMQAVKASVGDPDLQLFVAPFTSKGIRTVEQTG